MYADAAIALVLSEKKFVCPFRFKQKSQTRAAHSSSRIERLEKYRKTSMDIERLPNR